MTILKNGKQNIQVRVNMNKPGTNSPFFIFKPFDITTMGYYAYCDFKNLEYLKTKFDDWKAESNYLWQTKTKFENC